MVKNLIIGLVSELSDILTELDWLRTENERLREFERRYRELIQSDIKNQHIMTGNMIWIALNQKTN